MSLRKISNHLGDTIVEVMIVLTVLGLAISITYADANSSLLDIRQAEEHAQAIEVAQSQLEILRTLIAPGSPNIFIAGPYCLVFSGSGYTPQTGGVCSTVQSPYTIAIQDQSVSNPTLPSDTFIIVVTWPDVKGQGTDAVTLNYKLHS